MLPSDLLSLIYPLARLSILVKLKEMKKNEHLFCFLKWQASAA
jgi:hypothetical protein